MTAILLTALATAGCRSATESEIPRDAVALDVLPFSPPVAWHLYSGVSQRARLVIRDAAAWEAFWSEVTAYNHPPPPLPEIDFESETVLAAAMGGRSTGGYSIHIDDVRDSDGHLYVVVREMSPGRSCMLTQAPTAPVIAIRVPRRDGPVTFVERTGVHRCD